MAKTIALMNKSLLAFVLLVICVSVVRAETLYVQSQKADVLSEPNFKATSLLTLSKGQEVEKIGGEKNWAQVMVNGQQGWVSAWLLADQAPMEKVTSLTDTELETDNIRTRASTVTTAGAIRGLSDDELSRGEFSGDGDYEELQQMESLLPTEEEVGKFQQTLESGE